MSATIAIANQKGGVGKTTLTVNLAHKYALMGYRVLVVDCDVQGHAATCLGLEKGDGLYRLLVDEENVERVAEQAREILDLVTSSKSTARIRASLDEGAPAMTIGRVLEEATRGYDMVFFDLAPGSDILHIGSLMACDYFLVPAKPDYLALDGVLVIFKTVRGLAKIPNVTPPVLLGVTPTMFDRATVETLENIRRLGEVIGRDQILAPIPVDTHVREASSRGLTIWEYAPETAAAIGWSAEKNTQAVVNSRGRVGGFLHLVEFIEKMID